MKLQSTIPANFLSQALAQLLAIAMAIVALPLYFDLAVSILGNLRRPRTLRASGGRTIRLAAVVPAHNEETMIARTVASLIAAGCSPAGEEGVPVFVVAHNCSDQTAARARSAGAHVVELSDPNARGKGAALRGGFAAAIQSGANAFVVVDADSISSTNLIAATRNALASGAEATQCPYELQMPAAPGFQPLARLRVLAFRGINVLRARGRASLGFSAGIFGNGFGLTAETLNRVPYQADSICEDIEYHIKLVCAGIRVEWVPEATVLAPLSPTGAAQAAQEARWEGGRLHVAMHSVGPLLRAIASGNWMALAMLAEVWSIPLSRGIITLALMFLLPIHWVHLFVYTCTLITLLYVIESAFLGPKPWLDLAALATAPVHVGWKIIITPLVLRQSRKRAAWARTRREAPQP